MAVQKTMNEHQKTTDHAARSSHISVLRDATKERAETSVVCMVRDCLAFFLFLERVTF